MKQKLISAWKLLRSKLYILITDKESIIHAEVKGYDAIVVMSILKAAEKQLDRAIKQIEQVSKKGKNNGRNQRGRSKGSSQGKSKRP